jgi:hypothetical protein
MTNEQLSNLKSAAIPWTTVIAAVGLAWSAVGQLIAVRDDLLDHCHAVDVRLSNIEQWRVMHDARDSQIYTELVALIKQMGKQP